MSSSPSPDPNPLFTLPITTTPHGTKQIGTLICTQPKPKIYLLTFSSPPDNRLVTGLCQALILALDILEHKHGDGVVITTSGVPKFYSNGMDVEHAQISGGYMPGSLYALWRRLLTYNMPTVALINGHAFAGGLMVAMAHDYRIMNPQKGYISLNELELGMPLRAPMTALFRMKLSPKTLRKLILEAHRYKALDALQAELVDGLGGLEATLGFVEELQLVGKARVGASGRCVYGELKREMWRETVGMIDSEGWAEEAVRGEGEREKRGREREEAVGRVRRWEGRGSKL
ncbi:related to enoyl- hydratase isomerase [Lecanosticta acicola]|uniref:Related to enoyl- hydratase isomerase n=1 Tax=Lecanosticta acicola TaxID=111012 RepID=A0AAI9E8Q0_9PEZI|nr:related to enoyl- hydratase isomerase [Lecanosticta acicola]